MAMPDAIQHIVKLTAEHPEVAVELEDDSGRLVMVIFDGQTHPECLPAPTQQVGPRDVVRGSIYPKRPYRLGQHQDYEPIAKRVPLESLSGYIKDT